MTYNIISTGSKGNAVVINDHILIDCGVPLKALEPVDKRRIDVLTPGYCFIYKGLCTVMPKALTHDVSNCGYHIWSGNDSLFYATDTATLDGVEARGYDLYLIEANHTRAELETRAKAKLEAGQYAYEYRAAANHLSQEQALDWLYQQMGPNSRYVFLHQHQEKGD